MMSKVISAFKPPSLAQHFEPPDDYCSCFGWLCGYSADVGFLDDALERLTRRTHAQRAYEGRIQVALMLDPSNPQIAPIDVPGVLHVPLVGSRPFRLLHAKVALLGFRHVSDWKQWRLRLIVSTGNWTRETLERSLDLAWCVDFAKDDLTAEDDDVTQACADIAAAWRMLDWVRSRCDCRALSARRADLQGFRSEPATFEKWIEKAINRGKGSFPRVFDNRQKSLLDQLPQMVKAHGSDTARNYLGMGSGFYESSEARDKVPSVLKRVVASLKDAELLTKQPEVDVFVNPLACQAVADSVCSIKKAGWTVRFAGIPDYFKAATRSLHAKFIFSANARDNSELCNSPWLYLGSGNLTGPGFANAMDAKIGNLEAGVVFVPEALQWTATKWIEPEQVVTNVLPVQWETEVSQTLGALLPGSDMPDPETRYAAPPVAYLVWAVEEDKSWLLTSDDSEDAVFAILNESGQACHREGAKRFQWQGKRPRQVQVSWRTEQEEQKAWIPVIDELGRVAGTVLPLIDIDEAWGQLANFPMPPKDEEIQSNGDDEPHNGIEHSGQFETVIARYPVRQMMQLIENIAAKQTSVARADWVTWCTRFEQCLIQAANSKVLQEFASLQLNPLSPLWHEPFRPSFAENTETAEGSLYETVLKRVEDAWKVAGLHRIGVAE
jgi:hypothetical protein